MARQFSDRDIQRIAKVVQLGEIRLDDQTSPSDTSGVHYSQVPVTFKNDSGETMPGYGVGIVTGADMMGKADYLIVDKPGNATGVVLVNSATPVSDGKFGQGYPYGKVRALLNTSGTFSAGDVLGPKNGQWHMDKGGAVLDYAGTLPSGTTPWITGDVAVGVLHAETELTLRLTKNLDALGTAKGYLQTWNGTGYDDNTDVGEVDVADYLGNWGVGTSDAGEIIQVRQRKDCYEALSHGREMHVAIIDSVPPSGGAQWTGGPVEAHVYIDPTQIPITLDSIPSYVQPGQSLFILYFQYGANWRPIGGPQTMVTDVVKGGTGQIVISERDVMMLSPANAKTPKIITLP